MKKNLIIGSLLAAMAVNIIGCSDTLHLNSEADVEQYLEENGFSNCTVGDFEEGVYNHGDCWNVYDKENDIHFYVMGAGSYDGSGRYDLWDNYEVKLAEKHLDEWPEHDGITYLNNTDETYKYKPYPVFELKYESLADLDSGYESLVTMAEYFDTLKEGAKIEIDAYYSNPRSGYDKCAVVDNLSPCSLSEMDEWGVYDTFREKFVKLAYKYRFPEMEEELTESDRTNFWDQSIHSCVAVYRSGDPQDENNTDFYEYDDIITEAGITIGNLYYLLKEEGFDVEGTADNYTVQSINGQLCQFSYDFTGEKRYDSYFLVDGEETIIDYDSFAMSPDQVKEYFGLLIK